MIQKFLKWLFLIVFVFSFHSKMEACSAFVYNKSGQIILGANSDDCTTLQGLITINKRSVKKHGDTPSINGKYAQWISKYGSITFSYACRELIQYGMNEAGLVVSTVGLPGYMGSEADEREPLPGNFWSQYLLDNCATIDEVMNVEEKIRLINDKDQYLICDSTGRALIVQCEKGKLIYYYDRSLPYAVLTNERYKECLSNYNNNYIPPFDPVLSNKRFVKGCELISGTSDISDENIVNYSFDVLNQMSQHPCTQWSIVFNIKNRYIYYRIKDSKRIKFIKFSDFDFSCLSEMTEIEVVNIYSGNIKENFKVYSKQRNLKYLKIAFEHFGNERTDEQYNQIIDFLDGFNCTK